MRDCWAEVNESVVTGLRDSTGLIQLLSSVFEFCETGLVGLVTLLTVDGTVLVVMVELTGVVGLADVSGSDEELGFLVIPATRFERRLRLERSSVVGVVTGVTGAEFTTAVVGTVFGN